MFFSAGLFIINVANYFSTRVVAVKVEVVGVIPAEVAGGVARPVHEKLAPGISLFEKGQKRTIS